MTTCRRAALYVRVSTADCAQTAENELQPLQEAAARLGWTRLPTKVVGGAYGRARPRPCRQKADITPARSRRPAPAPQVPIINVTSQVWAQRLRDAGVNRCDLQTRDWVFQGLATGVVLTGRMHLAFTFLHPAEERGPMRAAVFHEAHQPMTIETLEVAKPGPHEVLLNTAYAGLCHSDLHFLEGLYPIQTPVVLGHESSAVVEAVGSEVKYVEPGDRVITCLSVFCGTCEYCTTGRPNLCANAEVKMPPGKAQRLFWKGETVGQFANLSSFAEQLLVHENAVVKIGDDIPLNVAALVGCGVITGAGAVINTAKVPAGSTVAVFGCGGIGLSAVNGAAIAGADRIIAIDMISSKLDVARQMGATDVINASNVDPVEAIKEMTGGGVEFSFEAVGLKRTAEQCFESLRPGGTATIIGMVPYGMKIELHGYDFLRERRIQGSSMGSNRFRVDMPRLLNSWKKGRLKLDHLISSHITLDGINEGYAKLKSGDVLRQLIDFGVAK